MKDKKQQLNKKERTAYALVGKLGGQTTFEKMGRNYMSKIGKRGAKIRWGKKKK